MFYILESIYIYIYPPCVEHYYIIEFCDYVMYYYYCNCCYYYQLLFYILIIQTFVNHIIKINNY